MEPNTTPGASPELNAAPSATEPAKKSKGLLAATVIFAILAIVGIGAGVYFFMDSNKKATENADLRAKIDLLQTETGAKLVEDDQNGTTVNTSESAGDQIKAMLTSLSETLHKEYFKYDFKTVFGDNGIIKVPGTETLTGAESYGIVSVPYDGNSSSYDDLNPGAVDLIKRKLTESGFAISVESLLFGDELFYNSQDGVYCWLSNYSLPIWMNCSSEKWISKEKQEFITALAAATPDNIKYINGDADRIENSPVTPYQTLTASTLGAALIYYRTSPTSDWVFFRGAQDIASCSEYDTTDLKNAFAGDACWDEATMQQSTVQP